MSHVRVEPAGLTFPVEPGESILLAALRQGVGLPHGCKDGACGSCKCRLIEGDVEQGPHRPQALSPDERARGLILACRATPRSAEVVVEAGLVDASAFPTRKTAGRVVSIERPASDVAVVRLQLAGTEPFRYRAGQYVELILRDGARRAYSLATLPVDPSAIELHIRHVPGGAFTGHVFSALKERDLLRVEGPMGTFVLRDGPAPIVLLASGTGYAPIQAFLEHIAASDRDRRVEFYWGARGRADLYRHEQVLEAAARLPNMRYVPVLSEPRLDEAWTGRTGLVHRAVLDDHRDLSGWQVYACGAPVMVESARRDFTSLAGLPDDAFFADAFLTAADRLPSLAEAAQGM